MDWSQASRQRSAKPIGGNSGIEKQLCMQGLRMDKARSTPPAPKRRLTFWPGCALTGIFTTGEEVYPVVVLAGKDNLTPFKTRHVKFEITYMHI